MKSIEQALATAMNHAVFAAYGEQPSEPVKIVIPPDLSFGDFAIECFALAKQFKKAPPVVAKELVEHLMSDALATYSAVGPYINARLKNGILFKAACRTNEPVSAIGKTVMVEYLSPNTNKPLHLGHVRNGVLGMAISNILAWTGHTVIKANLVNDRGVHICKSMLAWMKFANGETPESTGKKGDHFVGEYYVKFAQVAKDDPAIEDEAQALLRKWEEGDPETIDLWKTMNAWVYAGFAKTYEKLGFFFDAFYFESDLYMLGKDIVQKGVEQGIFEKDEKGAIIYMLPEEKFGTSKDGVPKKRVLLRSDGTSVYMTQDLGVAVKKAEHHEFDASIYVVACEQDDHFKVLFDILQAMGFPWAKQCHHLSYGMVELPSGRMKSREGTVVDADDLVADVVALAAAEVRTKNPELPEEEVMRRAEVIGVGAIKFYLIRANPKQKIKFDPQESIAFDGVTARYVQYAYVRAASVAEKASAAGLSTDGVAYAALGNEEERVLAQALLAFGTSPGKAAELYNPAILASAVYELAKAFHQFYTKHQVVSDAIELSKARLSLVKATALAIKTGLNMLGIDVLEKM
ncbi:MAG: arginine--tRNA ligase [Patescibacteria group bacterium]